MSTSRTDCRPCAWIDRCAARLRAGTDDGVGLDAGRAIDLAALLWEREAWRGDSPEHAATAHLQCEALLLSYRQRVGASHGH